MTKIKAGMNCPICESGKLRRIEKVLEYQYKGHVTEVRKSVLHCDTCDDDILQAKDEREIEKLLTDERRRVDGLLTSNEIKKIREKFSATQEEFADLLRVSKKSFARYETGAAIQSFAMDNLLRILDKHPESIRSLPGLEEVTIPQTEGVLVTPEEEQLIMVPSASSTTNVVSLADYRKKKEEKNIVIEA